MGKAVTLSVLLVLAVAVAIGYGRYAVLQSNASRSVTAGNEYVSGSVRNNTEGYRFVVRSTHPLTKFEYSEVIVTIRAAGPCGRDGPADPMQRVCTPPLQFNWENDETLTVRHGLRCDAPRRRARTLRMCVRVMCVCVWW